MFLEHHGHGGWNPVQKTQIRKQMGTKDGPLWNTTGERGETDENKDGLRAQDQIHESYCVSPVYISNYQDKDFECTVYIW